METTSEYDWVIARPLGRSISLRMINRWAIELSVALAIGYALYFLAQLFWGSSGGDQVTGKLPASPSFVVLLFLAFAGFTSLYFGEIGKVVAACFFGGLVAFFVYWLNLTSQLKHNLEVETLPHATNWLQNRLVGASWVDLVILIAATGLFMVDVFVVLKAIRLRASQRNKRKTSGMVTAP